MFACECQVRGPVIPAVRAPSRLPLVKCNLADALNYGWISSLRTAYRNKVPYRVEMTFLHQVAPVGFDCLNADVQKLRDLLSAFSLCEQLSDVPRRMADGNRNPVG